MATKLWGGRFAEKTAKEVDEFNASISFDYKLWPYDIEGSLAHVKMLARQKIISQKDSSSIQKGLKSIAQDIAQGRFEWKTDQEDVHLNIEAELIDRIGPVGGKLHTARSRNDQVALDARLYCRSQAKIILKELNNFQRVLVQLAEENIEVILPGYTHLQRAQPILLAHHLLAYVEMAARDSERICDALKRIEILPLGAGALAGTTFPIDRHFVAKELGFSRVSNNSLDSVSDRDFMIELLSACALILTHLSRLSEELILWSSFEFFFVALPDNFCTGSSMMPQKKNPDIPELIRGKTGRVFGNLMGLLTVMKGLPLAYNKDMQEDKEGLFDSVETTQTCLRIMTLMLQKTKFRAEVMKKATQEGFVLATDLADYLVTKGIPFRDAHHIVGQAVLYCQTKNKTLEDLSLEELQKMSKAIEQDVFSWLNIENAVNRRKSFGGTAKSEVKKQISQIKKRL
ncbi:MAG: argininosuccinate lyase [Deltaproteobacteria bacterium]|nr:argininosuccinate lyase [Deltaproteobacteria bacterium]